MADTNATIRTRSFGGCGTCRSRHMKCDEAKPKCSNCAAYGLSCDGYVRHIFFESGSDEGATRYRQLLFSDAERVQMNQLMTQEVPFYKTLSVISAIDIESEALASNPDLPWNVTRGPFGVFKLKTITSVEAQPEKSGVLSRRRSPSPCAFDFINQDTFQLPDWFESSSLWDFGSCEMETLVEDASKVVPQGDMNSPFAPSIDSFDRWLTAPDDITPCETSVLEQAPFLLKHYADNIITSLTPFRHTKTPWHVLFLPNAKNTLASLAMGEQVDDANLANFYGILSISASSVHHSSSALKWHIDASYLQSKAREHSQVVLRHALDRPKRFKYKAIVMSLITMIQVSMINGSWELTETYLLEAERIIRLRGLTKLIKSRRVRLLHHCYAYIRIFHESLSMSSIQSQARLRIMNAVEKSGVDIHGQDNLSFRLSPWEDLDKKILEAKSQEQGENDLHLANPGDWPATLYPEIFGVPETWMVLLSQVIRLGNEKEMSENTEVSNVLSLKEFSVRAKGLEKYILQWKAPKSSTATIDEAQSAVQFVDTDCTSLESMLGALRHALAIYFYRRIRDVEPDVLQFKVKKVRDCLFRCKRMVCTNGRYLNGLVWPAFIAGCEALDEDLQQSFSEWFRLCTQECGHMLFQRMHQIMQTVWQERRQDQKSSISWVRLLRSTQVQI